VAGDVVATSGTRGFFQLVSFGARERSEPYKSDQVQPGGMLGEGMYVQKMMLVSFSSLIVLAGIVGLAVTWFVA
jgi:hypothetical protein